MELPTSLGQYCDSVNLYHKAAWFCNGALRHGVRVCLNQEVVISHSRFSSFGRVGLTALGHSIYGRP